MGITRAVAVAAMATSRDVEDAAEAVFSGKFDHIVAQDSAQNGNHEEQQVYVDADASEEEHGTTLGDDQCDLAAFSGEDGHAASPPLDTLLTLLANFVR